jgi:hypothetical protein
MTSLTVYFFGEPGAMLDKVAHAIFKAHDGDCIGARTFVPTGERDVQYDVPGARLGSCIQVLKQTGFRFGSASSGNDEAVAVARRQRNEAHEAAG